MLKKLIQSNPDFFSTFVNSELKLLTTSEENNDYKKLSKEISLMVLVFLKDMLSLTYF